MTEPWRLVLVGSGDPAGGDGPPAAALARTLRDRGAEVILLDEVRSARHVAAVALQEDAAAVLLPGAPADLLAAVRGELDASGAADVVIVAGDAGTCVERLSESLRVADLTPRGPRG